VLADGLALGAVLEREDPSDVLIPAPGRPATLAELPAGARIGTSSLRRRAQLMHLHPDLVVEDLRGNLDTRFARLREGRYDAAILARAGVVRLGHADAIGSVLAAPAWLPAAGQGALGIAIREDDADARALIGALDDDDARTTTAAERTFLRALEGGCQIPIGALATREGGRLKLQGLVAALDGAPLLRAELTGEWSAPEALGLALAQQLLDEGAGEILERIRSLQNGALPRASAP
jgi:hydroxymethylbilane synthase